MISRISAVQVSLSARVAPLSLSEGGMAEPLVLTTLITPEPDCEVAIEMPTLQF